MNKIAVFLTILLAAGFVSVKAFDVQSNQPVNSWDEERKVQVMLEDYRCFKTPFDNAIEELRTGEISLKTAVARVIPAARRYHPNFFVYLAQSEPGKSDEERVARNLVAHIDFLADVYPNLAPRVLALKAELRELADEARQAQQ